MKSVEVFYNFMIMDANMNVFLRDPSRIPPAQATRMDYVWGDESWRSIGTWECDDGDQLGHRMDPGNMEPSHRVR